MSLLTGLFRKARKRLMTADADTFQDKLNELVAKKDELADEDIVARVDELVSICGDIPDGDDKAKLLRYLEDFKSVKEQDPETAQEAANMVVAEYEKLDKDAMNDAPEVETPAAEEEPLVEGDAPAVEEPAAEVEQEDAAPEAEVDATTEEVVEETQAPATEDEEPSYTLEDIYQFVKKRTAEDSACAGDAACGDDDKEEQEVVQDHALRIPVTTKCETTGSLAAMFENVKRGRN